MAQSPDTWSTAALAGTAALLTAAGAILKTLVDWLAGRGTARASSEDLVRDDLLSEIKALRADNASLRAELAAARAEYRAFAESASQRLNECEQRAVAFQQALAEVRGRINQQGGPPA